MLICKHCPLKFLSNSTLTNHTIEDHGIFPSATSMFTCELCDCSFLTQQRLDGHTFSVHSFNQLLSTTNIMAQFLGIDDEIAKMCVESTKFDLPHTRPLNPKRQTRQRRMPARYTKDMATPDESATSSDSEIVDIVTVKHVSGLNNRRERTPKLKRTRKSNRSESPQAATQNALLKSDKPSNKKRKTVIESSDTENIEIRIPTPLSSDGLLTRCSTPINLRKRQKTTRPEQGTFPCNGAGKGNMPCGDGSCVICKNRHLFSVRRFFKYTAVLHCSQCEVDHKVPRELVEIKDVCSRKKLASVIRTHLYSKLHQKVGYKMENVADVKTWDTQLGCVLCDLDIESLRNMKRHVKVTRLHQHHEAMYYERDCPLEEKDCGLCMAEKARQPTVGAIMLDETVRADVYCRDDENDPEFVFTRATYYCKLCDTTMKGKSVSRHIRSIQHRHLKAVQSNQPCPINDCQRCSWQTTSNPQSPSE